MTNNIKQERRYRRTEALILNGLTTLLQQKSIKEITVRELADLVDINRSTTQTFTTCWKRQNSACYSS